MSHVPLSSLTAWWWWLSSSCSSSSSSHHYAARLRAFGQAPTSTSCKSSRFITNLHSEAQRPPPPATAMAGGGGEAGSSEIKLEYTPTWIVAVVCSVIVFISFFFERGLHRIGKVLKRRNQKPLFEALQKVKEELMLLGFISLLLTVFQGAVIQKICIPESLTRHMLPCKREDTSAAAATAHYSISYGFGVLGGARRLLASGGNSDYCRKKGKVPLLSLEAIHQLHIFIFVLAVTHVVLSLTTVALGGAKIRQWKHWEDAIQKEDASTAPQKISHIQQFEFIQKRFQGFGKDSFLLSWLLSFLKQFYGSVSRSDYTTMRFGFIMTHCKGNPKFNFFRYMMRALEADFKKVVGISWYLWVFVMLFLSLNVNGWNAYFWISLVPLILLLAVGAKMEHIIVQLAHEVAEKHSAIEGNLVVTPSDHLFWFNRPRMVLTFIHFVLFQNAFEIAYFFWILTTYGFNSCIMGRSAFIIPRLIISVIVQLLCSYSTLPLYAIVTQMGSTYKKAIFDEHVQEGLLDWAHKIKRKGKRMVNGQNAPETPESRSAGNHFRDMAIEMEQQQSAESDRQRTSSSSTVPLLHVP